MDQKKTGQFLKTLRKEKNITQENLAETLNVSTRTISLTKGNGKKYAGY